MTQKEQILSHLLDGKSITNLEAIQLYGITRVSDIVLKLRKDGWPISTIEEKCPSRYQKGVATYGRYKMRMEQIPCIKD